MPDGVDLRHKEQSQTERKCGHRHHNPWPEPIIESAYENADEAGKDKGQRMSPGQGGPGTAKVSEERFEKDAERDMGADPCRLDRKAGGYNEIAIK